MKHVKTFARLLLVATVSTLVVGCHMDGHKKEERRDEHRVPQPIPPKNQNLHNNNMTSPADSTRQNHSY